MMSVKAALEAFISRVGNGAARDSEINVFPQVLQFYGELNGLPDTATSATGAVNDEICGVKDFPPRGAGMLVSGLAAAAFLGFTKGTHKRPDRAVKRLADEGKILPPKRIGDRALRYNSDDIWRYRDMVMGDERDEHMD